MTRTTLSDNEILLDAYLPNWRQLVGLGPAMFAARWREATGDGRASGYRWYHHAIELAGRDSELQQAA